ncbi:MAG: proteasome subunit alpha [Propionibacteriaceae bacterium]|jgi:proteasome alpha subunit|nr:proteasome subunit alpha [Propionibacteriaceae bacterium]
MSQPTFYVSPEQQIKDRAEFARSGIAKGRSVIVVRYENGILFIGENRSKSLHKFAEIYDRIGFAAVGKYNEFENLRIAGIRHADVRGYAYDRHDVTGRMLAGAYTQLLGMIFSAVMEKPYEVELIISEVGNQAEGDQIFRVNFDGSITEESEYSVIGGAADLIGTALQDTYVPQMSLAESFKVCLAALAADPRGRDVDVDALEVAVLDRTRTQTRKFQRLETHEIRELIEAKPRKAQAKKTDDDSMQ